MGKYKLYSVPLSETNKDVQEFEYNLDDKFFKLIDDTIDIRSGNLTVKLAVKPSGVASFGLTFKIKGTVEVPCDRCLDNVEMEVDTQNKLVVKLGEEFAEESDEVVVIPRDDQSINVSWFLFEFIVLSLPAKRLHPTGTCNKAMSAKYNKHRVASEEEEDDDDADFEEEGDDFSSSPWESLKGFDPEE